MIIYPLSEDLISEECRWFEKSVNRK